jgi:hypothetical protein
MSAGGLIAAVLATAEAAGLIALLIWLLVFALIIWVVYLILGLLPLNVQIKQIICVVLGIVFLIILLQRMGLI